MFIEFVIIFILTLLLLKAWIPLTLRLGFIDTPNERSVHTSDHPNSAGIAIFMAVFSGQLLFSHHIITEHLYISLALTLVFVVGIFDDYRSTSLRVKFSFVTLAAVLLYFDGVTVSSLGTFYGHEVTLGWLSLPFTIFAIVGFTNALNLIDGMDGLAGSMSVVILSALFYIGYINSDLYIMLLSGSFGVATLAFLIFNWHPSRIFLGDSGSLLLGMTIAILVILASRYIQPVSIVFLIAVPLMDTVIVMVRRKLNHQSIFAADKQHMHHILLKFFDNNVRKTVLFLILLQVIFILTALLIVEENEQLFSLILFILNTVLFYFLFSGLIKMNSKK